MSDAGCAPEPPIPTISLHGDCLLHAALVLKTTLNLGERFRWKFMYCLISNSAKAASAWRWSKEKVQLKKKRKKDMIDLCDRLRAFWSSIPFQG